MNEIQRIIKEEIIEPRITQSAILTHGYVMEYNSEKNTGTINIFDKSIGKFIIYHNVPMMENANGIISADPQTRSSVWIEFIGGNKNMPRASALKIDNKDKEKNASDNGQSVPDVNNIWGGLGSMISGILGQWR